MPTSEILKLVCVYCTNCNWTCLPTTRKLAVSLLWEHLKIHNANGRTASRGELEEY